eukprot:TRINITY_DN19125_c0_g1_i1.p1 TRINITY_DN19125_c0_g1~~TRINITY_DN19125_c0_g1_i1.p1  ORF type:complete len:283 (-),score=14.58 TRINITY_DN19125_c0_g1_i1:531-1379(-)
MAAPGDGEVAVSPGHSRAAAIAMASAFMTACVFVQLCLSLSSDCPDSSLPESFCSVWPALVAYCKMVHFFPVAYFAAWIYAFRYSPLDLEPASKEKWARDVPFLFLVLKLSDAAPDVAKRGVCGAVGTVSVTAIFSFVYLPLISQHVKSWLVMASVLIPYVAACAAVRWLLLGEHAAVWQRMLFLNTEEVLDLPSILATLLMLGASLLFRCGARWGLSPLSSMQSDCADYAWPETLSDSQTIGVPTLAVVQAEGRGLRLAGPQAGDDADAVVEPDLEVLSAG